MAKLSLTSIGPLLQRKRSKRGIREVAAEIGISPATLSRVENGKVPDLNTFTKICQWLDINPNDILGHRVDARTGRQTESKTVFANFRADKELKSETVKALAEMILRARKILEERVT